MIFLPGGSGTTIRHNTQIAITHQSQANTAHKTTRTINDKLHKMNRIQIQLQLRLDKLILIKIIILYTKQ
jgi:hypothetical protein